LRGGVFHPRHPCRVLGALADGAAVAVVGFGVELVCQAAGLWLSSSPKCWRLKRTKSVPEFKP
jgi:hypothetical protein